MLISAESSPDKDKKLKYYGIPVVCPYLRPYRKKVILMILLCLLVTLIDAVFPLFNRYALNHFVLDQNLNGLTWFVIIYVLLLFAQSVMNYVDVLECGKVELYVGRDLKNAAFMHLQTLSFSFFNQNSVGYLHARVMSDTDRIGTFVSWRLLDIIWNASYLIMIFIIMAVINLPLTGLLFLIVSVAFLLIWYCQKKLLVLNREIREINSQITGHYNEGITGAQTIRNLNAEVIMKNRFMDTTGQMRRTSIRAAKYSSFMLSAAAFISSLAAAAVLYRGGILTARQFMQVGTLSVFLSYATGMLDPVSRLTETLADLLRTQASIERFHTLVTSVPDVTDTEEVTDRYGDIFQPRKENWEKIYGHVEFKDVSFHYPDGNEMILEHFNLDVPSGTCVAIVGETGAGKSTLVNLVCRFFEPTEGKILIDGKNVRDRSALWLHSHIGYVLQTPHLFSGTVRDNMRYGKPDATDEQIMEALHRVAADEAVARMGDGLDSQVGEGGGSLSVGEKQLISFARALIADPAILILDEATSSIDTLTENQIQAAVKAASEGRTTFMIAHRLSTVVNADVILVVQDGKVIERGTHDQLMDRKGYYFELFTRQYGENYGINT